MPIDTIILPVFCLRVNQRMKIPTMSISRQRDKGKNKGATIFLNKNIFSLKLTGSGFPVRGGLMVTLKGSFWLSQSTQSYRMELFKWNDCRVEVAADKQVGDNGIKFLR